MASNISNRLSQIKKVLDPKKLNDIAYPVFVQNTPIKTGNARKRTSKHTNEIVAAYPYATRLDQGYSSQSPQGMVKPAIEAIRSYIKRELGK